MFDTIIVPKSYLKGLLTKDQEKLIKDSCYQTKSLENFLGTYKVYRQKLFFKKDKEWVKDTYSGKINFYTSFYDKDENVWWAEYEFIFKSGILDKKELIKFALEETAEEAETRDKEWEKRGAKRKAFERTLKYKFYNRVSTILYKLQEWAYQKTLLPVTKNTKKKEKLSFWKHS